MTSRHVAREPGHPVHSSESHRQYVKNGVSALLSFSIGAYGLIYLLAPYIPKALLIVCDLELDLLQTRHDVQVKSQLGCGGRQPKAILI
jgi:hypothetical protein